MATENQNQPPAIVQPPAAPAAPVVPDPNKEPADDPAWLGKRLERAKKEGEKAALDSAKKAILAELGIEDPDAVKKIVADQKKRDDERKSVEQRLAEKEAAEKKISEELAQYRDAVKVHATEQLSALNDEQKSAVVALAGEDPARQIKTIAALRPTWKTPAAPTTDQQSNTTPAPGNPAPPALQPAPPKAPPPKPADTAPPAGAPPPAGSVSVSNHLATYELLQKTAPFSAPVFYLEHRVAIDAAKQARGG